MIYCPYGNIVNFSCMSQIHLCVKSTLKMAFKPMDWKKTGTSFSLEYLHPHLIHKFFEPTPLTSQTSTWVPHGLLHSYATKSPLVKMGCPNSPPKIAHSPLTISTPSNTSISQPTLLTTPNSIQIQSAIFHSSPSGQTYRPTDGIGNRRVSIPAYPLTVAMWLKKLFTRPIVFT